MQFLGVAAPLEPGGSSQSLSLAVMTHEAQTIHARNGKGLRLKMNKRIYFRRLFHERVRPYSIPQLKQHLRTRPRPRPNDIRQNIKILVIDDKTFTPLTNLQRHHFYITHWEDIPSIEGVVPFQVVLSDIDGVGLSINPQQQGVGVIAELRRNFPEKYVIAYTGKGSSALTERAIQIADDFLKKDADIEDWVIALDRAVEAVTNPVFAWKRTCLELLKADVSPYEIALMEDIFVASIINNENDAPTEIRKYADRLDLSPDARAIIINFISSAIFEFANSIVPR
jgi:ActR/RegA family two-component response regulator